MTVFVAIDSGIHLPLLVQQKNREEAKEKLVSDNFNHVSERLFSVPPHIMIGLYL